MGDFFDTGRLCFGAKLCVFIAAWFALSATIAFAEQEVKRDIIVSIVPNDYAYVSLIKAQLPETFMVGNVTYECDVVFSRAEFDHVTELHEGKLITTDGFLKAIAYLGKKNKFERIDIRLQRDGERYNMHFSFVSFWTFAGLKLHGIMIGKDFYRQYYGLELGDRFDEKSHNESVEKILAAFAHDGYCNGTVSSKFVKNNATKELVAHLTLRRGSKFYINAVDLELWADEHEIDAQHAALRALLVAELVKKIRYRPYSKQLINNETQRLKRLMAQKGYMHVSIELQEFVDRATKCVNLIFKINAHHKKELVFLGNSQLSNDQLLDALLEFGNSAWLLPASILAEEITTLYQKIGFWKVRVMAREENGAFIFNIQEGSRVLFKNVIVRNTEFASSERIVKECFLPALNAKYFDAELIKDSINAMITWYQKNGFLNIKIEKKEFVSLQEDIYGLDLAIQEGERVYFGTVKIEAFPELENQPPFACFNNDANIPFDGALLHEQRKWLLSHFQNQGYIYVGVKPLIEKKGSSVCVVWNVVPGEKVYFGKTIVQGSSQFPFEYIERELQYKPGQEWNKTALRQSFLQLKALDIFEQITFSPDNAAKAEIEKPVILRISKDDPFELRARFGAELLNFTQGYSFATGITYKAGGAFIYKNPFNCGDQFKIDADFTRSYREFAVQYQKPWLFNRPVKTLVMGYANKYEQPGFMSSTLNVYEAIQSGFLVGLSRLIGHIDWGINVGFEWMKTRLPDRSQARIALVESIAKAINFNPLLLDQSTPYFQVEPSIVIDYLDNKIAPTCGSLTVASCKGMFPLKKEKLNTYTVKMLLEQSFFVPIKAVVGALRVRFGHIFFREFSNIMPIERFYLGGANSLRGYDTDFAPPVGKYCQDGKERYAPQGGKTMANINAEIRFPIYKNIGGVVFQDLGALSGCGFADFRARDILASTGLGVRVATPIGPLRFDIAWKWKKQHPDDRLYAWFLAFGQAF